MVTLQVAILGQWGRGVLCPLPPPNSGSLTHPTRRFISFKGYAEKPRDHILELRIVPGVVGLTDLPH